MTKICCIHPSVRDVKSFLSFTCLDGVVDPASLVWDSDAPDLLFASEWTFYRKDLFDLFSKLYAVSRIKVAWMGEAVAADMNIFDYAVGFDGGREGDPRFVRLPSPLDMFHRFIGGRRNDVLSAEEALSLLGGKTGFCNFLYSNPDAHPMRDRLFNALCGYKRVDSLGKHLNNTGVAGTGYGGHYADCTSLKRPYRFSIASENAEYEGYTTEKIFTSLAAHTVPVYWGNPSIAEDVNPACFINARDFIAVARMDELVKFVAKLDADPELWAQMVSAPWFTPEQEARHEARTAQYRARMKALLDGSLGKRVPEGYHVELYRKQFFKKGFAFGGCRVRRLLDRLRASLCPERVCQCKGRRDWSAWFRRKGLGVLEMLSPVLSDKSYICLKYRLMLGSWPDLKHPSSLNEKIQAMKIYDRNPLYTKLVDKAAVKEYVKGKLAGAGGCIIPTLGVWERFEDIDFASLPDSFVLKCTHDSGSAVIVRDKKVFLGDAVATAAAKLSAALAKDYSRANREWPYRDVPRRIIAEPYIADLEGATDDYKFFCSDGKVRFLFVATGRSGGDEATRFDFFDPDWNHLPLTNGHPNALHTPERPANFDAMLALAAKLSEGLPFVRVDLYNIDGRILFGEYTFSHWGGFKPFDPPSWDLRLGEMLD